MRITLDIDLEHESAQVVTNDDGPPAWRTYHTAPLASIEPAFLARDLVEPLRDDQRRALFAGFTNVFGTNDPRARHLFTRVVLGKDVQDTTSWSTLCGITAAEAHVLLNALDGYERVQSLYHG